MVLDDKDSNGSSKVAAGLINPVTGRRYAYSWMIEEMMSFALESYTELGNYLDTALIQPRSIIDFFPTPQSRINFIERLTANDTYLHSFPDQNHFNQYFNYEFGCGEIRPAYTVHLQFLLEAWGSKLEDMGALRNEKFELEQLDVQKEGIAYKDITASRIVFCEGVAAIRNQWFDLLPFSPNKGEVLIIECEGLTREHVYKKGMMLVPLPGDNLYWLGSSYQWEFEDEHPSEKFYDLSVALLNGWLKKPYRIISHKSAIRPATLERRPFVGFHPLYENIGILNGMGTKGTSLAPFFAHQLVQHIIHQFPITPEADVKRFSRILSK